MTRLAVLSDIHGNLPALEAVIVDMKHYEVDHVIVAGDHINMGPSSRQVMEIITEHHWSMIRGNNEYYSLDFDTPRVPEHWATYTLPPFVNKQLGKKWLNVVAGLPDSLSLRFRDAPPIFVCHGIPDNPWQSITPLSTLAEIQTWLSKISETTVICGHSHIPMERHIDHWHIFNPGSVGMPLDGQFTASYMILDGNEQGWDLCEYRRISFDYDSLYDHFERERFADHCGIQEQLVIEEFRTAQLQFHPFILWRRENYPNQTVTEEMLNTFLNLDDINRYRPIEYRELDGSLYQD